MKKALGPVTLAYPMPAFLVAAYDEDGKANIMTAAVVPDIGMFASFDPVALDHACIDAVNAAPVIGTSVLGQCKHEHNDHFTDIHPQTNWRSQIEHAQKIGIGNADYELVTIK